MSYFMNDPVLTLATLEDVRAVLNDPNNTRGQKKSERETVCGFTGLALYRIKAVWLVALIDEIAAKEYPYNATVKKLARERLGLPPLSDKDNATEGDTLSLLIYNAQCFRHSDNFRAEGFEPFTEDLLRRAREQGAQIEAHSEGIMGSSRVLLTVRQIDGKLYAMRPKMRKRYVSPQGQPARLVPPEAPAPKMMRVTVPTVLEQKLFGTPITYEPE